MKKKTYSGNKINKQTKILAAADEQQHCVLRLSATREKLQMRVSSASD
jgi:hypothetical protein